MERLRHDDPPRIGTHITLGRLDDETERALPVRRFIARSADGDRTLLAFLPHADVDPTRWAIEAEGARRLSIPGFLPVTEVGGTPELPWCTAPYAPALPLPAALRAHGGPLPEPVVRALGAALARALATAHAQGVTHAGLSPATVLLTPEGPRLSCFGAVRAVGPDGERRSGLPGLDSGSLAPEQASGGRPRPLGDVYALGAVLAYAATGHTVPERAELPVALRELVSSCLSRDPERRPQALQVLAQLEAGAGAYARTSATASTSATARTSATATPAAPAPVPPATPAPSAPVPPAAAPATLLDAAATPIPLPPPVIAALARQSAEVLAAELPPAALPHPAPAPASTPASPY